MPDRGVRHPQRREDSVLDVFLVVQLRRQLDDVRGEHGAEIRVRGDRSRREDAARHVADDDVGEGTEAIRGLREQAEDVVLEARRMRHEVFDRDRLWKRAGDVDAAQILVHIGVQIEPALLDQLHHGGPQKHLRVRADAEQRAAGIDRRAPGEIGEPVAFLERDAPLIDNDDDRSGHMVRLALRFHDAVDEAFPRVARVCCRQVRLRPDSSGRLIGGSGIGRRQRKDHHDDYRRSRHMPLPPACLKCKAAGRF